MDLRPFTRKNKAVEENTPAPSDEFAQFYSSESQHNAPSAEGATVNQPAQPPGPTVTMDEDSVPGWYPDSQDPGLLRYWDGFHLTGQTLRIDAPEPEEETTAGPAPEPDRDVDATLGPNNTVLDLPATTQPFSPPTAEPATAATAATAVQPVQPVYAAQPARPAEPAPSPFTPLLGNPPSVAHEEGEVPGSLPGDPRRTTPEPASTFTVLASSVSTGPPTTTIPLGPAGDDSPADESPETGAATEIEEADVEETDVTDTLTRAKEGDIANHWAEETEKTVARAESLGTPEAWQDAARAAGVVTDMAQVMRTAADTAQTAARMERAARDAERRAETAALKAEESRQAVQKTAQVAAEAAKAAKEAAHAAAKAKQIAEQNAQEAPELVEAAEVAGRAAAEARRRARAVEEIVAKARATNTPGAWSKAHNRAVSTMESQGTNFNGD
jgi:hypothetical protein